MGSIVDDSAVILELGLSGTITNEEAAIIGQAIVRAEGAIIRHLKYDPVQRLRTEYYPQQDYSRNNRRTAVWEVEGGQAILRRRAEASVDELMIQHIPIRDTPAIDLRIDFDGRSGKSANAFAPATLRVEGTDYWPNYDARDAAGDELCRDGIIRSFGLWPTTPGTVRIIYTAGYTAAEFEGQDAIVNATPIWDTALDESARRAKRALVIYKKGTAGHAAGPFTGERLGDYSYTLDGSSASRLYGGKSDLSSESVEKLSEFLNYGHSLAS